MERPTGRGQPALMSLTLEDEMSERTYGPVMKKMAERAMRACMQITASAQKLDNDDELIDKAHRQVHALAVATCALANIATRAGDHHLHSELAYYVAQINKASF